MENEKDEKQEVTMIYPPVNIYEDGLNYYYKIIAPGFDKSELDVSILDDKYITVSGNYTSHVEHLEFLSSKIEVNIPNNKDIIELEYKLSSFSRKILLYEDMDISKISSTYSNGILEIKIDKKIIPTRRVKINIE